MAQFAFLTRALPWLSTAWEGAKSFLGEAKKPARALAQRVYDEGGGSGGILSGIGRVLRDVGEGRAAEEGGVGRSIARSIGEMFGAGPTADYQARQRGERALKQYKDYSGAYREAVVPLQESYMQNMQRMMGLAHLGFGNPIANMPFRQMYPETYFGPAAQSVPLPAGMAAGAQAAKPATTRGGYNVQLEAV